MTTPSAPAPAIPETLWVASLVEGRHIVWERRTQRGEALDKVKVHMEELWSVVRYAGVDRRRELLGLDNDLESGVGAKTYAACVRYARLQALMRAERLDDGVPFRSPTPAELRSVETFVVPALGDDPYVDGAILQAFHQWDESLKSMLDGPDAATARILESLNFKTKVHVAVASLRVAWLAAFPWVKVVGRV